MTFLDLGEGVLRGFGALYIVGAVFLLNQLRRHLFMDKAIDQLDRMAAEIAAGAGEPAPPQSANDGGRTHWMIAGGVLLLAAGMTMVLGLRVSVLALGVLALHQLLYFVRQRRRELAAATPDEAQEARPTPATRNGFLTGLVLFVLAGWLERSGALS